MVVELKVQYCREKNYEKNTFLLLIETTGETLQTTLQILKLYNVHRKNVLSFSILMLHF